MNTPIRGLLAAALAITSGAAHAQDGMAGTGAAGGEGGTTGYETEVSLRGAFTTLNEGALPGEISGGAAITEAGFDVAIVVIGDNVPTGMHVAMIHGFPGEGDRAARCPDEAADANDDGFIDREELAEVAGEGIIPLTHDPDTLRMAETSYPVAGPEGKLRYRATLDLDSLEVAIRERHDGVLKLDRSAVVLYGATRDLRLPRTVAAAQGRPGWASLPIACAALEPVGGSS